MSNFAVAVVRYLLGEAGWLLDYGNGAPDPQRCWWEPRGPQRRLRYFCSSKERAPWHSQMGLLSPPILFCSPTREITSVLFRAGAVSPCGLCHGGVAPPNALCFKSTGEKTDLSCVWSEEHSASRTGLSSSFLSLSAASGKLPPSSLLVTSNSAADPRDLLCWEPFSPLLQPQDLLGSSLPPSSQRGDTGLLLMCTCRTRVSSQNTLSFTTKF